jgi:transcription elongation factor GreA
MAVADAATDLLEELERAGVERPRIDQVANLIELASNLDDALTVNGGAGVGSVVRVADRLGRTTDYELIARSDPATERQKVTLGSPTGRALLGSRPGDVVRIPLKNGRRRRVRVLDVELGERA